MAKGIEMTEGNPFNLLLRFTLPTLTGNLLHQVYSITDGIVVGKCLGDTALSGVAQPGPGGGNHAVDGEDCRCCFWRMDPS